jgi:hypothetical protein
VAGVELKGFLGLVDWHWAVKMGKEEEEDRRLAAMS